MHIVDVFEAESQKTDVYFEAIEDAFFRLCPGNHPLLNGLQHVNVDGCQVVQVSEFAEIKVHFPLIIGEHVGLANELRESSIDLLIVLIRIGIEHRLKKHVGCLRPCLTLHYWLHLIL